ncbi:MAG: tetratricopeptide repeat protein [Candidatus Krumholzibacteria bacterium]|nr:tetratricopeptide repeat protein [Candidatus Krumholzibacteria bacterium]
MSTGKIPSVFLRAVIAALVVAILPSCVYFNKMYNARRLYGEAEEMEAESSSADNRGAKEKYSQVVIKCSKVLRDHPGSSWVDDAVFLMGKALVKQKEYSKGSRKFLELTTNFPESEYVPHALYWLALTSYERHEYNQALLYLERYIEGYPDHEISYMVLFLAGDTKLELGKDQEALAFYSRVAESTDKREIVEESMLKSARLYYLFEDWENAAQSYSGLLRKGLKWQLRYDITLALADCYVKIGKCNEALRLYEDILPDVPRVKDEGPVWLGLASSYICMDSLDTAMSKYETIVKKFPHSNYSAEGYYRLGKIYHERLDSLQLAQNAFEMVGKESSSSEFAAVSTLKASSIRKLLELRNTEGGESTSDQQAGKQFEEAEIQLTRLGEILPAISNYRSVIDSFPQSQYAPMAAYAVGWIYRKEVGDSLKAAKAFSEVIERYPRSPQAKGALSQLYATGFDELAVSFESYIDSAMADTAAIAADMRRRKETAMVDSISLAAAGKEAGQIPDGKRPGMRPVQPPVPVDRGSVEKEKKYTLDGNFRPAILEMVRREKFERMRRWMWGSGGVPSDSTRVVPGRG